VLAPAAGWLVDEWIEAEARLFLTVQWLVEAEARLRMALQDWRDTVGGAATVCTIVQFLVGAQVCMAFYRAKSTGESSILTFLVGVVMTFVWMNYGVMVNDSTIQTVNAIGLMLQSIYVCCFYSITSRKLQTGKKIFLTVLFLLMVGTYIMTQEDKTAAQLNIGWLGASMSVAYCSAPLASIQEVCRSRSTKSLPFYLILVTCVVTGLWTLYGHIIEDSFVSVPNCLGFLAASFQLGLFSYFPSPPTEYKPLSTEI